MKLFDILFFFFVFMFHHDVLGQDSCIDENLINVFAFCTMEVNPVCGCDGNTYSNSCLATNFFGITSFTEGECEYDDVVVPCDDLGDVDFGMCDMVLGIAMVNGECSFLSGCGWEVNGVDYSPAFYDSIDACNAACSDNGEGCFEGGEYYPIGDAYYLNECEYVVCEGFMYWSEAVVIEDCENNDCINQDQLDDSAVCIDIYMPVCGCDGVTYSNECYAYNYGGVTSWTEGECQGGGDEGCISSDGDFYLPGDIMEVSDVWCENYTCSAVDVTGVNYEFILNADLYPWECDINSDMGCVGDNGDFYLPGDIMEVSDVWCENYTCSAVDVIGVNFEFILNADLYPWECDPIWEDGCYADDGTFYLFGEVLEVSDNWCENYTCIAGFAGFMFLLNADLYPMDCDINSDIGCVGDNGDFYLPGEILEVSDDWCENYTCSAVDIIGVNFEFILNADLYPGECDIDPNLGCFEDGEYFPVGAIYYLNDCEYVVCEGVMDWSEVMLVDDCETNDCIDPTLIDLDAACYDLWDPVCGCDGVTYSNDCYAVNYAGVTSFTLGPCNDVPGGCTYIQALNYQPDASWDDGSCLFAPCNSDCTGDVDGDSSVTVNDILQLLGNFGTICQ